MENTEKTTKIDGISAQINLSPGSETHKRFAEMLRDAGATTARSFVEMLMDSYENPPQDADSAKTIIELEKTVDGLKTENETYGQMVQTKDEEIADLKAKLEEANRTANENAVNGLGKQAQIEDLQKQLEGAIVVKPNPVSAYFLKEMAAKENSTPGKILERLFIDDLQNPRANNLPYTVSASRIREVMEELKPKP